MYSTRAPKPTAAFATAAQLRVAALVIGSADPLFGSHAAQLGALALRHSVPAIYFLREFAAAGGLMSYGGSITETYRLPVSTPGAFSGARSPLTCRCSRPRRSSCTLTSRRPRRLASPSHCRYPAAQTS